MESKADSQIFCNDYSPVKLLKKKKIRKMRKNNKKRKKKEKNFSTETQTVTFNHCVAGIRLNEEENFIFNIDM